MVEIWLNKSLNISILNKHKFTAWTRWFYTQETELTARRLYSNSSIHTNAAGVDWLKDLLRRKCESLDPWVKRLRDQIPDCHRSDRSDHLDELGPERPLLVEALRHDEPDVRACALKALEGSYDQNVRQEMLPLLKDPSGGSVALSYNASSMPGPLGLSLPRQYD